MQKRYERLAHTADLQLHVWGITKQELFANALYGMFVSMGPVSPECVYDNEYLICHRFSQQRNFTLEAPDIESLLVDFLSYALCLSDIHNEAYEDVVFTMLSDTRAQGSLKGVALKRFQGAEIKAVTYHDLRVIYNEGRWEATIVFDI